MFDILNTGSSPVLTTMMFDNYADEMKVVDNSERRIITLRRWRWGRSLIKNALRNLSNKAA